MDIFLGFLPHGSEWIWIALIAVLLFGSNKLPELARGLGRSIGEFKKGKEEVERELREAAKNDPTLPKTDPAVPTASASTPPADKKA